MRHSISAMSAISSEAFQGELEDMVTKMEDEAKAQQYISSILEAFAESCDLAEPSSDKKKKKRVR